jgi:hypothetical protein
MTIARIRTMPAKPMQRSLIRAKQTAEVFGFGSGPGGLSEPTNEPGAGGQVVKINCRDAIGRFDRSIGRQYAGRTLR